MAPAFSKEAILVGCVDHLCLVCESYLRTEREVMQHVGTAGHRENMDSTRYVDKYASERVRKVKNRYFCEFCNNLMFTITTVGLHVEEPGHKEKKSSEMIARAGDVIVSGDIKIEEEAWHGFIDGNTCTICNVEYHDKHVHKNEPTHVINLIQSKVIDINSNIYRKIDDSTFHCLTCNEVVAEIIAHFNMEKHRKIIQDLIKTTPALSKRKEDVTKENGLRVNKKCIEDKPKTNKKIHNENGGKAKEKIHTLDILDSIPKIQEENVNTDNDFRTTNPIRREENQKLDSGTTEKYTAEHKKNMQINEDGTAPVLLDFNDENAVRDSELSSPVLKKHESETEEEDRVKKIHKMAEARGLTYNSSSNKLHCRHCNKRIPSSTQNINEHINGESHKNNVRLSNRPTTSKENKKYRKKEESSFITTEKTRSKKHHFKKVSTYDFINMLVTIEGIFNKHVVLNVEYFIDYYSFAFFTKIDQQQVRCHICEVNLPKHNIEDHVNLSKHKRAMMEVPVIIRKDSEFIREIRSGIFQCGFCNIIDTWDGMENHLKSIQHKEKKTSAKFQLAIFLPEIMRNRHRRSGSSWTQFCPIAALLRI